MSLTLEQRTLSRARQLVGTTAALARAMLEPEENVRLWLQGQQEMPTAAFLRAIDVVNDGGRSLQCAAWREDPAAR